MGVEESNILNPANYPPNKGTKPGKGVSPKEELPKKKVEKIVSGEVIQQKKPLGRKMLDLFRGEEAESVGGYLIADILLPSVKNLIYDLVTGGAERSLFGTTGGRRPRGSSGGKKTSYDKMYGGNTRSVLDRPGGVRNLSDRGRATHDFDEIVIEDRGEAEQILDRLTDLIGDYEVATVADLYDLVGIASNIQDEKWGWTNLGRARIMRQPNGYLLALPKTEPLD